MRLNRPIPQCGKKEEANESCDGENRNLAQYFPVADQEGSERTGRPGGARLARKTFEIHFSAANAS